MKKRTVKRGPAPLIGTAAVAAVVAIALPATAAAAAPNDDPVVASGEDWSIATAPGGYLVTYELDEPLPIVGDAPTLLVDGEPVGLATESADGLSLSVVTTDRDVADAESVERGWASGDAAKAQEGGSSPVTKDDDIADLLQGFDVMEEADLDEDPSDIGEYGVTEAEYDFGDRAVALAAIGGIRGEMTGKMYLSDADGARPVVVLLHGRHSSCSTVTGQSNPLRWPCLPEASNVRSYLGYEDTARALASHGYNVVSIAANAVNSNDNQLALDYGAQARGQLVLDSLSMLDDLNSGKKVSFDDVSWPDEDGDVDTVERSFEDALEYATSRSDAPAAASGLSASDLTGRFDLSEIGLMGHSRGGEGVVSAATLNQAEESPYGIVSVLPLAPVDFGRMTLPDIPMSVFLPYCDGDVSNQQGQHLIDDSRHAFGDDVMRSAVWIMGANHNFFNSVWTPGKYPVATSDDWRTSDTTSSCATNDDTRLSADEQYQAGVSYMTGYFRLTMGGETQFQQLFDGSVAPRTPKTGEVDVRVMATQPAGATTLVTDFASSSSLTRAVGTAKAQVCANMSGRAVAQDLPVCTTEKGSAQVPHWTPVRFALDVPSYPVTQFTWGASSSDPSVSDGELRVSLPKGSRDVSQRSQLTVKMAPVEGVEKGTDVTISVIDGEGEAFRVPVSEVNALAVNRMPGGTHTTLNKVVLQQVTIPVEEMSGIDLSDVREVRLTPGAGADETVDGGLYLSDLAFDEPQLGTAVVQKRTTLNVAPTIVEEGNGPGTADIAVYLDRAQERTAVGYVSTVALGPVGASMERVEFAPGETCRAITVPVNGDRLASAAPSTAITVSATNTTNAVMGASAFSRLTIREDDGVVSGEDGIAAPAAEGADGSLPVVGAQGDACAELAASRTAGELESSAAKARPGDEVTFTGRGFRSGEAVTFGLDDADADTVIADADGVAATTVSVSDEASAGTIVATALGAGSARILSTEIAVAADADDSDGDSDDGSDDDSGTDDGSDDTDSTDSTDGGSDGDSADDGSGDTDTDADGAGSSDGADSDGAEADDGEADDGWLAVTGGAPVWGIAFVALALLGGGGLALAKRRGSRT